LHAARVVNVSLFLADDFELSQEYTMVTEEEKNGEEMFEDG